MTRDLAWIRRVIIVIRDRKVSVKREKNFIASYFTNKVENIKVPVDFPLSVVNRMRNY